MPCPAQLRLQIARYSAVINGYIDWKGLKARQLQCQTWRMKQGKIGVQVHLTASSSAFEGPKQFVLTEVPKVQKRLAFSRCFPCFTAQVSSNEPEETKKRPARENAEGKKKATKMWRFFGGVFQPVLGTANYLLSPIKPLHKPVILPSGKLFDIQTSLACQDFQLHLYMSSPSQCHLNPSHEHVIEISFRLESVGDEISKTRFYWKTLEIPDCPVPICQDSNQCQRRR